MRQAVFTVVSLAVMAGVISGCNVVFPERTFSVSPNEIVCSRGEGNIKIDKDIFPDFSMLTDTDDSTSPSITYVYPNLSSDDIVKILGACKKFVGWP